MLTKWINTIKGGIVLSLIVTIGYGGYLYRESLIERGRNEVRMENLQNDNKALADALIAITQLTTETKQQQEAYQLAQAELSKLALRLSSRDKQLRDQQKDFERKLAAANDNSIRDYAKAVTDNFNGCRKDVERFGLEAGSCAAAAEALKANNESLVKARGNEQQPNPDRR